jgi:hypothetical protein
MKRGNSKVLKWLGILEIAKPYLLSDAPYSANNSWVPAIYPKGRPCIKKIAEK